MKKVQLKNKSSINNGSVSGPMGDEMTLNERGLLDDNSGSVEESFHGYDYYYARAAGGAITVRYLITWIRTKDTFSGNIALDDNINPDQSGFVGDPIVNSDPVHYKFIRQELYAVGTSGVGTLTGSWIITFKTGLFEENGEDEGHVNDDGEENLPQSSGIIVFQVPSYDDLTNHQNP